MEIRSVLYTLLVVLMGSSIVCSVAIQAGHADVPVAESAALIEPLAKGDAAPRFVVETVAGETFDFNPARLERPVVLLAFRGGWCPYCNTYLSEMRHVIPEIRELGVDVLFLSGDRPARLFASLSMETQEDIAGLDYTLLSDANAQASMALGIAFKTADGTVDRYEKKGRDMTGSSIAKHGVLSVPSVFAIDREGTIQFVFTNADYKIRLPGDELVQVAREIAAAD